MTANYPTSLDTITELVEPGAATSMDASGYEHHTQHTNLSQAVRALEAKVGISSSPASGASARYGLMADGSGGSTWRALVEADISDLGTYSTTSHTHTESDITDLGSYLPLGGGTMTGSATFSSGSTVYINNGVSNRYLYYQTSGLTRWQIGVDNATESGSDAGSNFFLSAYTDAGSWKAHTVGFNRSTNATTFYGDLLPNSTNTKDIGSSSARFAEGYVDTLYTGDSTGSTYNKLGTGINEMWGVNGSSYGPLWKIGQSDTNEHWAINHRGNLDGTYNEGLLVYRYDGSTFSNAFSFGSSHQSSDNTSFRNLSPDGNGTRTLGSSANTKWWSAVYARSFISDQDIYVDAASGNDVYIRPSGAATYQLFLDNAGSHRINCTTLTLNGDMAPLTDGGSDLGTSALRWGAVHADDYQVNDISLGRGMLDLVRETSTATSTISTETDLTNIETSTISVVSGRRYRIFWSLLGAVTQAGDMVQVKVIRTVSAVDTDMHAFNFVPHEAGTNTHLQGEHYYDATGTASHTFKVSVTCTGGGTFSTVVASTYPTILVVEDVGDTTT